MRLYSDGVTGLWRSVWNAPSAAPPPPRRVWRDWVLVALLAVLAVVEGTLRTDLSQPMLAVIPLLAVVPTVLWRRTRPLLMLVIVFVVTVPTDVLLPDSTLYASLFVTVIIYALFRWGSGRDLVDRVGAFFSRASECSSFAEAVSTTSSAGSRCCSRWRCSASRFATARALSNVDSTASECWSVSTLRVTCTTPSLTTFRRSRSARRQASRWRREIRVQRRMRSV